MAKESVLFTREDCAQSGSYANDVLKEMFYDLNFRDVTLATDDGEEISAHKIVLSSGSNLLKTILGRQGKSSPIIICRGVRFNELKSMIEFIYLGQTSVENVNVKNFLAVADEYGIQGLAPVSTKKEKPPSSPAQEEYKVTKARNYVTFNESKDPCIKNANILVDKGPKSDTPGEVKEAKERLRMKELTGIPNRGREGLGMHKRKYYSSSTKKDQRDLITVTIREKEEEKKVINMAGFPKQGANMKWEVPQRRTRCYCAQ